MSNDTVPPLGPAHLPPAGRSRTTEYFVRYVSVVVLTLAAIASLIARPGWLSLVLILLACAYGWLAVEKVAGRATPSRAVGVGDADL